MASAVDSRLAYARLSAVATASRLPTANRGSNNSYATSWDTTSPFAAMTGLDRDTSKSPDRTGVCCTGRCAPSQCETITGPSFSSLNKPDQERTPAYRDSSGSESPSGCLLCYFFRRLGGAIWGIPGETRAASRRSQRRDVQGRNPDQAHPTRYLAQQLGRLSGDGSRFKVPDDRAPRRRLSRRPGRRATPPPRRNCARRFAARPADPWRLRRRGSIAPAGP